MTELGDKAFQFFRENLKHPDAKVTAADCGRLLAEMLMPTMAKVIEDKRAALEQANAALEETQFALQECTLALVELRARVVAVEERLKYFVN
jgi:hypothetical protein